MQEHLGGAVIGREFRDHLAVIGGGAEHPRVERNSRDRLALDGLGESRALDFRALGHADLIKTIERRAVVGPRRLRICQHVLGVAQIGKVRLGDDQDVIRPDQGALGPGRPLMRNVEHDAGRSSCVSCRRSHRKRPRQNRRLVERRRRRQQTQVVGAFRKQALHDGGVGPIRLKYRVGYSLYRILIVVETRGTEGKIEIDDDGIQRESRAIDQATLCATVDAPTPPFAPTTAMIRPTGDSFRAENRPQIERTTSSVSTGPMT